MPKMMPGGFWTEAAVFCELFCAWANTRGGSGGIWPQDRFYIPEAPTKYFLYLAVIIAYHYEMALEGRALLPKFHKACTALARLDWAGSLFGEVHGCYPFYDALKVLGWSRDEPPQDLPRVLRELDPND